MNANETITSLNDKTVVKGKLIALNAYIRKQKKFSNQVPISWNLEKSSSYWFFHSGLFHET